ncbi:hypothetical protein ACYTPF_13760 [Alteromonas sp. HB246098]
MAFIKLKTQDINLYSPFSGACIYGEEELTNIEADDTVLYTYFESEGEGYISERILDVLNRQNVANPESLTPAEIAAAINIPDALLFEYDGGFNGISWFIFAPAV